MQCPFCEGAGKATAFHVHYADGSGEFNKEMPCPSCWGSGKVDDRYPEWRDIGERMRQFRRDNRRTLRDEAVRRGMSASVLSSMERGLYEPRLPDEMESDA